MCELSVFLIFQKDAWKIWSRNRSLRAHGNDVLLRQHLLYVRSVRMFALNSQKRKRKPNCFWERFTSSFCFLVNHTWRSDHCSSTARPMSPSFSFLSLSLSISLHVRVFPACFPSSSVQHSLSRNWGIVQEWSFYWCPFSGSFVGTGLPSQSEHLPVPLYLPEINLIHLAFAHNIFAKDGWTFWLRKTRAHVHSEEGTEAIMKELKVVALRMRTKASWSWSPLQFHFGPTKHNPIFQSHLLIFWLLRVIWTFLLHQLEVSKECSKDIFRAFSAMLAQTPVSARSNSGKVGTEDNAPDEVKRKSNTAVFQFLSFCFCGVFLANHLLTFAQPRPTWTILHNLDLSWRFARCLVWVTQYGRPKNGL